MIRVATMYSEELQSRLAKVEFIRLKCALRCEQSSEVKLPECLALRPVIVHAAQDLASMGALDNHTFMRLFDPDFEGDTLGRKRFQKPAPPFVLRYSPGAFRTYQPGELFRFELVLMGAALAQVSFFVRLLELLGEQAFGNDGAFELYGVEGWDDSENLHPVWFPGDDLDDLMPPVCTADWWVMRHEPLQRPLSFDFVTPARVMKRGKPLFRPDFKDLFPFMLRRVTALCYAHADQLLLEDVQPTLASVENTNGRCTLLWEDWRSLQGAGDLEVGGLMGHCSLNGEQLEQFAWVLALAELFQIGRGATYGAGKIEFLPPSAG